MSTEDPHPPSEHAPPPPAPPPSAPAPAPSAPGLNRNIVLGIVAVVVFVVVSFLVFQDNSPFANRDETYDVAPYTPPAEMVAARERVEARAAPDPEARVIVMYGEGATINVTGRVSRGIGNEWYAVTWNDQTAFVRTQDAVAGSGAPPTPEVREEEEKPEDELKPEELEEEMPGEDIEVVEASPSGTLDMADVNWIREPNARDFARYYPTDALDERQSGRVTLDCVIGGNGRLDCSVAQESPSGHGFGDAAISISRQVRVDTTLPDGSPAAGRHMRLPLAFRVG